MPRFSRIETLNAMLEDKIIPLFYNNSIETSKKILEACAAAGVRCVEFTNRGDRAIEVFRELEIYASKNCAGLILGAGSIADAATASEYIRTGANFIVSAFFDSETAILCNKMKVPYSPGCATLTEIKNAEAFGVEICKLFPGAECGGPGFIKAVLGPSPRTKLMPTGGVDVTEESLSAWFKAGACCVGLGSKLIPSDIGNTEDYRSITEKLKAALRILSILK